MRASLLVAQAWLLPAIISGIHVATPNASASHGKRDLVFMHVPHNFGHTVEMVAAFGNGRQAEAKLRVAMAISRDMETDFQDNPIMGHLYRRNESVWGAVDTRLYQQSKVNCTMYVTPPKYWPGDLAKRYFGGKKVFGILRDPYERLVSYFRASVKDESGDRRVFNLRHWAKTCDVNGAVNYMMKEYLASRATDPYMYDCAFLPQSEYFGGEFGVALPVDNRKFPASLNRLFKEHGYDELFIGRDDVLRATGCSEVWAGALTPDTRKLVREAYAKDFELICSKFGYCDREESTCMDSVRSMCPRNMTRVLE